MSDERKQLTGEPGGVDIDGEQVQKESKKKSSKRWRKRSSKGEMSPAQKEFQEDGKKNSDLGEGDDKVKGKEKKSLKGRIRKISLRKLSKTEKKTSIDNGEKSEKQEAKACEEPKIKEAEGPEQGPSKEQNEDGKMFSDDNQGSSNNAVAEVEIKEITVQEELIKVELKEEDETDNKGEKELISGENEASIEPENSETHFETSTEVEKREDAERRQSKENFDAVIVELANKDTNLENDLSAPTKGAGTGNENNNKKDLEENSANEKPSEEGELIETKTEKAETLDEDKIPEKDGKEDPDKADEETKFSENERLITEIQDDKMKNVNTESETANTYKNDDEAEGTKVFGPTKDENLDLSQKIAKKAMGKVVGRYRQVQLTKTYCQCCSVM